MAILKNPNPRRREIRKALPRAGERWTAYIHRRDVVWTAGFVLVFTIVAALLAHHGRRTQNYYEGQELRRAVVPRVSFDAINEAQTLARREQLRRAEPAVYRPNEEYLQAAARALDDLTRIGASDATSFADLAPAAADRLQLSDAGFRELKKINADETALAEWKTHIENFLDSVASIALLSASDARLERDRRETQAMGVKIRHPRLGELERLHEFVYSMDGEMWQVERRVNGFADDLFPEPLRPCVVAAVLSDPKPIYVRDVEETNLRRNRWLQDEDIVIRETHRPDQVLIAAGVVLSTADLKLIDQERQAYFDSLSMIRSLLAETGAALVVMVLSIGLWLYIIAYNPRIIFNTMRGAAMSILMLSTQALAVLLSSYIARPEAVYAAATFPTILVAIVLAIAYDQRFALSLGAIHALLVAISLDQPLMFVLIPLTGAAIAVAQLREVRTRSKLVVVGMWTGLGMAAIVLAAGFATRDLAIFRTAHDIIRDAGIALGTGVITGIFVQGVLPGIERAFKVTTSMTLKELNDVSLPLLSRLAKEAPGTYHHSLRIADMSEAAAETIGANGLLCRVGAMYHDIGKINKPQYFVENQGGGPNRHNKLKPAMSLLIIVGHVKDGVELAREYGLPPVIRQFIESHHGTTLVEYFYHAAKQRSDQGNQPAPQDFEYRYPGPKPQTREAAILMLCDGLEGAARTLDEPTPARLEQLVNAMSRKRLLDGQFDESNLTLKELSRVEHSVTQTLCAIYHGRVKYPGAQKPDAKPQAPQTQPTPPQPGDDIQPTSPGNGDLPASASAASAG